MDKLKELFGETALNFADFMKKVEEKGIKLADLSEGGYVVKDKLDTKIKELEAANKIILEKDEALKKFDGVDIEKLKSDSEAATKKYQDDMASLKKEYAIDTALFKEPIHDTKAIKAFLDMGVVKVENDEVLGLKEQLEKLKTEKPFLFKEAQKDDGMKANTGGSHSAPAGDSATTFKSAIAERMNIK